MPPRPAGGGESGSCGADTIEGDPSSRRTIAVLLLGRWSLRLSVAVPELSQELHHPPAEPRSTEQDVGPSPSAAGWVRCGRRRLRFLASAGELWVGCGVSRWG